MWKVSIYLCINVHPPSTQEIITTKMCKKIYNHGQCVICVTLKFQATPHFLHNLLGLVHSCLVAQFQLSCCSSLPCLCNWWHMSMWVFFIVTFWKIFSPLPNHRLLLLITTSSWLSSSFVGDFCHFLINFFYWWSPPPSNCHLLLLITISS